MSADETERFMRERVAVVEWRLDELRDQLREARADVRGLDAKLDEALQTLCELRARPSSNEQQGTSLTTRGVAGMTAGLSTIIAVIVEVVQHLVTKQP